MRLADQGFGTGGLAGKTRDIRKGDDDAGIRAAQIRC
jgi:hypothetical protein